jgi:ribosomal protein S27AE
VPPPQCPECGRFLATAFVNQIQASARPCPRCGTSLFLDDGTEPAARDGLPDEGATVPAEAAAVDGLVVTIELDEAADPTPSTVVTSTATLVDASAESSVRPADLAQDGASIDPLAGWDVGPEPATTASLHAVPELAIAAGAGVVIGFVLGGRDRRTLGALLGAVLGALLARLRA